MHSGRRLLTSLLLTSALSVPVLTTACAHHYRTYDTGYGDYHTWNSNETVYYNQWETQNHYDHREFKERDRDQQKQYYDWRHQHDNASHDNDHHDNDHHDNDHHDDNH